VGGLALPAVIGGFAVAGLGGGTVFAGAAYLAMTALVITLAYKGAGLGRGAGSLLLATYAVFLGALIAVA
jgi:hypothetical protein